MTKKIMHFVMDGQPLSAVGVRGFWLLFQHLEIGYNGTIISQKHLSNVALIEFYGKVCKHILKEIKYVKAISFTTDIWSSDVSLMSLQNLTAHWLDENFVPLSAVLNATNFRVSHTSKAIALA